jgi:uncharacterized lipoprotein
VVLGVVLLAGCGGGKSKQLTKEEYASKADAVCSKYSAEVKALGNPKDLSTLTSIAEKTLPIVDSTIADLKKLEPPSAEKALASQWLAQMQGVADDARALLAKAKAKDLKGLQSLLPKAQQHLARSNALASQLGMSVCSKA